MASRVKKQSTNKTDTTLRLVTIGLSILGVIDSTYLLIYKYSSNDRMCLGNGGCSTVNYSPYSEIYGIPVSLLGILGYLAILLILILEPFSKPAQEYGRMAVFGMGLVGVLFSAYLTYIEAFVIYAYCPFCVVSAILMVIIFILSIIRLIKFSF